MLPGADIDLLATSEQSTTETLRDLHDRLSKQQKVERLTLIEESKQPVLRALVGDLWLDIQAASSSEEHQGQESRRARECAEVARALRARVASVGAEDVFGETTRFLKLWAKRRGISGAAWGFWPGIAWATVAAKACVEVASVTSLTQQPAAVIDALASDALTLERVLKHAFASLAGFHWGDTYSLDADPRRFDGPGDWMPMVAPGAPDLNLTRGMTTTTAEIMQREFARASKIARKAWLRQTSWRELLEPGSSNEAPRLCLSVTLTNDDLERNEAASGLLRGRVMKLILELEQGVGARPRPWPFPQREDDEEVDGEGERSTLEWSIGLPGTSATQHELARLAAEDFVAQLCEEDERVHFEVRLEI